MCCRKRINRGDIMNDPYILIPSAVYRNERLTPLARLVYGLVLALGVREGWCWASNATIAAQLGVTPDTVSRAIRRLDELGYIRTVYSGKGGSQRRIYPCAKVGSTPDKYAEASDENVAIPPTKMANKNIKERRGQPHYGGPAAYEKAKAVRGPKMELRMVDGEEVAVIVDG